VRKLVSYYITKKGNKMTKQSLDDYDLSLAYEGLQEATSNPISWTKREKVEATLLYHLGHPILDTQAKPIVFELI